MDTKGTRGRPGKIARRNRKDCVENSVSYDYLRSETVGRDFVFTTPYGKRLLTYADYAASGRALYFIERYILEVQRQYANTHTEDDFTGSKMTHLLHQSEYLIKKAFNAEKNCIVIPTGTGATGAILKLQQILGVYIPPATKNRMDRLMEDSSKEDTDTRRVLEEWKRYIEENMPVVFISSFEHHSNELMWREALATVVRIRMTSEGVFDLEDLKRNVSDPRFRDRMKIGTFSAASNVTGLISPVYEMARTMHRHGGIACFDFAASAPYVKIDMNKDDEAFLDAIYISPHKFLGGPGSCGLLVINKRIYRSDLPPTCAAGGTVRYVNPVNHDYADDPETRERAGTPGVLQTIKAALAIMLKDAVGIENIEQREKYFKSRAFNVLSKNPSMKILGNHNPMKRIPIFSLLIKHEDKYLHPNLGTALLNDLFGIQSRSGCSCAGPYGHELLNIDPGLYSHYREVIRKGYNCIRPGWLRVNFHYTLTDEEFEFILRAMDFVARHGYLFIPDYVMDMRTGMWTHSNFDREWEELNLKKVIEESWRYRTKNEEVDRPPLFKQYLDFAYGKAKELERTHAENYCPFEDPDMERLRFFYFTHSK